MSSSGTSDDTGRASGARDLVVCPRCRDTAAAPGPSRVTRCPTHGETAMVSPSALSAADGDPFLGMIVGARFAILERLGAGSMGTVYRARQEAVGRDVALKVVRSERLVDPQAKGRFRQEAHATSVLTSPHTVTVFDFGEIRDARDDVDGSLFLAMELLYGESLGDRVERLGRIPPEDAVRIVGEALASLAEAHEKGVIHRDLKPDNLLLTRDPSGEEICKVLDFGIAKLVSHQDGIDALETQAGTVFGTPRYMSPEQAQGKALDARSDVYSLGVILYHMLVGRPPFTDGDAVVVMAHHIKTVPKRPTMADPSLSLPVGLEDLLMRVLDKDPERRPQSARAFMQTLDEVGPLEPAQSSSEMTAVVGQPPASASSRRRVLIAGSLVAAVIGLLAAMAVTGAPTTEARAVTGMSAAVGGVISRAVLATRMERKQGRRAATATPQPEPDHEASEPEVEGSATARARTPPPTTPVPVRRPARGYERFDQ